MTAGPRGFLAGLLLAVHPWHVRFSVEMRGYSAMLLALTLGVIFLLLGLRDGRWRWWLASAAMNLWALLAFAGCLYVPVVANAGCARLAPRQKTVGPRRPACCGQRARAPSRSCGSSVHRCLNSPPT